GADDTPAPREAEYLSSHPPTTDRVAALEAMVAQARAKPEPLLEEVEWRRLRASCGIGEGQGRVARGEGSDYQ
ncbi:MAG TPA: hypothetical protein VJ596_12450, partial [Gemmatimonadaceae bacterium]|nr:hypothetical protein [Gemmatimonadaceae bacterium]